MTDPVQILDTQGHRLAKGITDPRRYQIPGMPGGLGVLHSGRVYPLVKTPQGWVIRLNGPSYARKACTVVAEPVQASATDLAKEHPQPAPIQRETPLTDFERQWLQNADQAVARKTAASAQAKTHAERVSGLHEALARADRQIATLKAQITALGAERDALMQQLRDDKRLHKCESTNTDLRGQLVFAQREVEKARSMAQNAQDIRQESEAKVKALRNEQTQLRQQVAALDQRLKACLSEGAKERQLEAWQVLRDMVSVAWPRIQVRPESWTTLATYCTEVEPVARVLFALNNNDPTQAHYSITANGWREVQAHITTGKDDRLRVYWRPAERETLEVILYYKTSDEDQQAFHRQLAREK